MIPDSVYAIPSSQYSGCTTLRQVVFLQGGISIGEYAFQSCTNLVNVTIHNATAIGDGSFGGCTSLGHLTIIGDGQMTLAGIRASHRARILALEL